MKLKMNRNGQDRISSNSDLSSSPEVEFSTTKHPPPPRSTILVELLVVIMVGGSFLAAGTRWQNPLFILLSIICSWLLIHFFLKVRRSSWAEFGFHQPSSWGLTIAWGLGGTVALHILIGLIFKPLITHWLGVEPDISRFDPVRGNLLALSFMLLVVWTTAAFGEEMIFRGFFLNRINELGTKNPLSLIIAILISSVFFGLGHSYQGLAGIILTTIVGLVFCGFYLLSGRNLWVTILIHGFYDTSAFMILFLNLDR